MATLTIRKLDDKVVEDFKRIAKKNNRSAEAQARSLIEDFTAGVLAHDIMSNSDSGDVGPARRRIPSVRRRARSPAYRRRPSD